MGEGKREHVWFKFLRESRAYDKCSKAFARVGFPVAVVEIKVISYQNLHASIMVDHD